MTPLIGSRRRAPIAVWLSLGTVVLAPAFASAQVAPELLHRSPESPARTERATQAYGARADGAANTGDAAALEGHGKWPLSPTPEVVHGFAPPSADWQAGHRGVDLAGIPGQSVLSALEGTVRFAGRIAGKGVVVIDHGGTRTTYEPVVSSVRRGEAVAAGAVLGRLEVPFSHCFPAACLHWGWRDDIHYFDPLLLVGVSPPIRLLPMWRREPGAA